MRLPCFRSSLSIQVAAGVATILGIHPAIHPSIRSIAQVGIDEGIHPIHPIHPRPTRRKLIDTDTLDFFNN